MKRFATVLLFTTLLCGCPEAKTEPAPAPAASEETTDEDEANPETAEELEAERQKAAKKGTDKANKALDNILGGG